MRSAGAASVVTAKITPEYRDEISKCARQYNEPLYRFLFRLTQGDHALAQDLVQQVLMEAAQNWAKFRVLGDAGQRRLLYVMAERRAIDAFRKNSVARESESRARVCRALPETDPHAHAVTAAAVERFIKVIEALPRRQALAASLHWRCGWTNAEIAEELGITRGAVTRLLAKAGSMIRCELGPYLPFEPRDREEEPDHG
jgi:RNA polymerase sigma-70 factor (ECF subfamily)